MSKDFLRLDGTKYRTLSTGPIAHMEARGFSADLPEDLRSLLADCSAALVRVRCPKKSCGTVTAEVAGNPRAGALVAVAFDRGPEPIVRTGTARGMGVLGSTEKVPDQDLALFWPVGDLPVRWPLRCPRCRLRSEVLSAAIATAAIEALASGTTITCGASRTR